jgi:hypothetical protein
LDDFILDDRQLFSVTRSRDKIPPNTAVCALASSTLALFLFSPSNYLLILANVSYSIGLFFGRSNRDPMTTPPLRVERRVGQRFPFLLPVSLREPASGIEGLGFTQDVSSRGAFFFTDTPLREGAEIELTLQMPAEITLGEKMRVRCRCRVLRVTKPEIAPAADANPADTTKIGVAVRLEEYEYLPQLAEGPSAFQRVSALHEHNHDDRAVAEQAAERPISS